MAKTSTIYARVEPEVKAQAEAVLDQLGIPMSNAIDMFLRQVVLKRGIPFELKLNERRPLIYEEMTQGELNAELQKGLDDIEAGRVIPAGLVHEALKKKYGL